MATGQKPESQGGKSRAHRRWFVLGGIGVLVVGIAAGAGVWRMQSSPQTEAIATSDIRLGEKGQSQLPIGRITVNISASTGPGDKRGRFLVIEPTLVYLSQFDTLSTEGGMAQLQPALRDSFIEYLSQLHENDIYGSAGLAELREELLRRARLVSQSEAPVNILLQDFVLQ